jgi:uncharacterized C2H2 Zn-finger protein
MSIIDCEYTDEIVCPYCRYEFHDSWKHSTGEEDIGETECPECDMKFQARRNVEVSYSTGRDCELNGEKHETVFTGKILNRCSKCDQYFRKELK